MFEMGTGVSSLLLSPDMYFIVPSKLNNVNRVITSSDLLETIGQAFDLLVSVS